ncbi:MAG: Gfo/Idh/MocA family oxidoreductase [Chloroflexi bacterium]|nr:Gfo/Idh/MocA family oxidoreductase [Chloroflexota bacterium]
MSHVTLALIGAGDRGFAYGKYALDHPDEVRFVAVADPIAVRRDRFATDQGIAAENRFAAWEDLLGGPRLADAVIVATPDRLHVPPAVAALEAGYDVLLEKPMANTLPECVALVHAARRTGRSLQVCHVLRYSDFFNQVYRIVQSGRLGDLVTVEQRENVAYYHMAHSFVRGNWRRQDESSPMILAKCCHDLDLLTWIVGERFTRLSSVGSLRHFRAHRAPRPDIPPRCTDGCPIEAECPFSAPGIYLERRPWRSIAQGVDSVPYYDFSVERGWPASVLAHGDMRPEVIRHALETGPYGRCVYHCDNDVVDHQVVSMQSESGISVTLTMHGHSHEEGRTLRLDGTRATLEGRFNHSQNVIMVHDHLTGRTETVYPLGTHIVHGGGDAGLMQAFVRGLREGIRSPLTSAGAALDSHLLAFAAEQARLEGTVIDLAAYRASALGTPDA